MASKNFTRSYNSGFEEHEKKEKIKMENMPLSTHSNELEETLLFSRLKDSKFPCQKSELNELLSEILKKYYEEAVQYNKIFRFQQ